MKRRVQSIKVPLFLYHNMDKKGYTYILTNQRNWTLYVWVTSNIEQRMLQHKYKTFDGFTAKHNLSILVRLQEFSTISEAILQEKKIKWRTRYKKLQLIEKYNPERNNLAEI